MSVKLRLTRLGKRHRPFFRLNAVESRTPRDGRIIEKLGHYDPIEADSSKQIVVNRERVEYWLRQGAIPTDTVSQLLLRCGIKHKYAQEKAAKRAKAKALARKKGKFFTKAERVAAAKAEQKAREEAAEKAKAEADKAKAEAKAKADQDKTKAEAKAKADQDKAKAEQKSEAAAEQAQVDSDVKQGRAESQASSEVTPEADGAPEAEQD